MTPRPLHEAGPRATDGVEIALAPLPRWAWNPADPGSIEALQVIYKVAERCNINCTYCYYFNMGETTPLTRPALASLATTEALAQWIAQGCSELRIPQAKVCFHGGEPTLVGVKAFDETCRVLRRIIEPVAKLSLSIQTNGVLLDDRWIDLFSEHAVGVGVSIDGPQAANDLFRLDRRGRSTFDATETSIRRLVAAGAPLPSTISVVHSGNDYREVYRYLRSLGVTEMNFLLPDRNVDDVEFVASGRAAQYGSCLADIFVEWLHEDNADVHIKFISEMLSYFRADVRPRQLKDRPRKSNQIVIARSDGTVAVDDTFIPALDWYLAAPVYRIEQGTLRSFFGDPVFQQIEQINRVLPTGCAGCRWSEICHGGDIENRFSRHNGFDNPSVYCESYKVMYQRVCDELVQNGYPAELVAQKFGAP